MTKRKFTVPQNPLPPGKYRIMRGMIDIKLGKLFDTKRKKLKPRLNKRDALTEAVKLLVECEPQYDCCPKCGYEIERPFCNRNIGGK